MLNFKIAFILSTIIDIIAKRVLFSAERVYKNISKLTAKRVFWFEHHF